MLYIGYVIENKLEIFVHHFIWLIYNTDMMLIGNLICILLIRFYQFSFTLNKLSLQPMAASSHVLQYYNLPYIKFIPYSDQTMYKYVPKTKEFCNRGHGLSAAIQLEETASHSSITNFLYSEPNGAIGKICRLHKYLGFNR